MSESWFAAVVLEFYIDSQPIFAGGTNGDFGFDKLAVGEEGCQAIAENDVPLRAPFRQDVGEKSAAAIFRAERVQLRVTRVGFETGGQCDESIGRVFLSAAWRVQ